jgi:ABC-type molybdate transport system substrate-binding protein
VTVIKVPAWAQPKVQYGACIVTASGNKTQAQAWVKMLVGKVAQKELLSYGFLPRVKPTRRPAVKK